MAKVYYDKDASLNILKKKKVAVIGYGSQGHAHALNLKDSGIDVRIGLYEGSKSAAVAKKDGFRVLSNSEAAKEADVIMFAIHDYVCADVFENEVLPHLKKGQAIAFCHGFAIHYKLVQPPKDIDVFMVAPKGPGPIVRQMYLDGKGVPMLFAVEQNATKKAKQLALAWAKGIGGTRAGVIETTFKEETETDLFGEQTVLCGGMAELILAGYETLIEAGYQPEAAYFECCHEVKLIMDLIFERGFAGMNTAVSDTAEYGGYKWGRRVIGKSARKAMKKALEEIQNGKFATEWMQENKSGGRAHFLAMRRLMAGHPIEETGARLRKMMKK